MFLHSGVAFHGHEFSKRAPAESQLSNNALPIRRSPISRSAFSNPIPTKSTIYENSLPVHSQPIRPLSEQIQRSTEQTVRFQEPETMSEGEDGRSVANSEGSYVTVGGRRKRRTIRTSTTFHLAHPAPTLTQKQRLLHIRPKLLLQLQRLSADSRPMPAVDVLPSTVVVPRLAKKFPRMFRGKGELGCNDVMVVKSEEYHTPHDYLAEENNFDEESLASRDIMAVICQMRKDSGGASGKAEIVLSDGSVWISTPMPNGLFEFMSVNENGHKTTARWVRRSIKRGSVGMTDSTGLNYKFTFSIIDPNSRRHPILAILTQKKLDIPDFYTSVSPSAGKYPPTSPVRGEVFDEEPSSERTTHVTDESTKRLIQVTGIWIALRQGWSPYFKYNDAMSPRPASVPRARSMSLTPDGHHPSPVPGYASTPDSVNSFGTLGTLGNKIRRVSIRASPSPGDPPMATRIVPQRSVSAGTAFMQREKARRIGIPPSTVPSDDDGEGVIAAPYTTEERIFDYNRMSTPPIPLMLPGSASTTPYTPTRPCRYTQSLYVPPSALKDPPVKDQAQRHSMLGTTSKDSSYLEPKPKCSRWKAFTNMFRRSKSSL